MKRALYSFIFFFMLAAPAWATTSNFTCASGSCEWNTGGNWSSGVPTASVDATFTGVAAGTTITITTTGAVAKSVDFTGAAGAFTLTNTAGLSVWQHHAEIEYVLR